MSRKKSKISILVGTRKGGFILSSDENREYWDIKGPVFKGWNVMHMVYDEREGRTHAAVIHDVYGPSTHYSDDLGGTWIQASQASIFTRPSYSGRTSGTPDEAQKPKEVKEAPENVLKIWHIRPASVDKPRVLYAGIEPAALFVSHDSGDT